MTAVTDSPAAALLREAGWPEDSLRIGSELLASFLADYPGKEKSLEAIARSLAFVADGTLGLRQLRRFVEAHNNPPAELERLRQNTEHRHLLCTFFSFSAYLGDIAIARPEEFHWLLSRGNLRRESDRAHFARSWREFLAAADRESWRGALVHWQRRQHLRTGVRELLGHARQEEICRELSALAEVILSAVLEKESGGLLERHGTPKNEDGTDATFAVLAAGKLGGNDLNFSSDVDLLFFYSGEGSTDGVEQEGGPRRGVIRNHEYFNRLGQAMAVCLGESTHHEELYRVDLRLRPDGEAGPLARSMDGWSAYLHREGRTFERVAYLRARFVAGDDALGARAEMLLERFVYEPQEVSVLVTEISALKRRIDEEQLTEDERLLDIKRGTGGIREIEFLVALRQLLHAPTDPALRTRHTMTALRLLKARGAFTAEEARLLEESYYLLRRIEHTVQMMHRQQSHQLPSDAAERRRFALRCGWPDHRAFEGLLAQLRGTVHRLFTENFGGASAPSPEVRLSEALESGKAPDAEVAGWLERSGIPVPEGWPVLRAMMAGTMEYAPSAESRRRTALLLPLLLREVRGLPDPVGTLRRFDQMLRASKGISTMLALLLSSEVVRGNFLRLAAFGPELSRQFCAHPEWLDVVLSPWELAAWCDAAPEPKGVSGLREHSHREAVVPRWDLVRFAVGTLYAMGEKPEPWTTLAAVASAALSDMADRQQSAAPRGRWVLLGLGGIARGELFPRSDLDVLLLCEDESDVVACAALYAAMQEALDAGSFPKLDLRLRPEGESGPLATTARDLHAYFADRAALWEWIAVQHVTVLCGDLQLGADALSALRATQPERLERWDNWRHEMAQMRRTLDRLGQSKGFARTDLKRAPGALWDLDYLEALECFSPGSIEEEWRPQMRAHRHLLRHLRWLCALLFDSDGVRMPDGDRERDQLHRALLLVAPECVSSFDHFSARCRSLRGWLREALPELDSS